MVDIGNPCPSCEDGKLYPTGDRERFEKEGKSEFGAKTEMKCDKCGYVQNDIVRGVNE